MQSAPGAGIYRGAGFYYHDKYQLLWPAPHTATMTLVSSLSPWPVTLYSRPTQPTNNEARHDEREDQHVQTSQEQITRDPEIKGFNF